MSSSATHEYVQSHHSSGYFKGPINLLNTSKKTYSDNLHSVTQHFAAALASFSHPVRKQNKLYAFSVLAFRSIQKCVSSSDFTENISP